MGYERAARSDAARATTLVDLPGQLSNFCQEYPLKGTTILARPSVSANAESDWATQLIMQLINPRDVLKRLLEQQDAS